MKLPTLAVSSLLLLAGLAPVRETNPSLILPTTRPTSRTAPSMANRLSGHEGSGSGSALLTGHNVDVTVAAGTQNETTVAVDPTDPLHMIAASNDWGDSFGSKVYESLDGGRTWQVSFTPPVPHACYDPWVDF